MNTFLLWHISINRWTFLEQLWPHQYGDQLPEASPAWHLTSDPPHQPLHLQVVNLGNFWDSHHDGDILGETPGLGKVEPNLSSPVLLFERNKGSCAAIA